MRPSAYLLDAGLLVGLLNRRDQHHMWARRTIDEINAPLITCEPALTETWHLTTRGGGNPLTLLDLAEGLNLEVRPIWNDRTRELLRQYTGRASVADAGLLMLAEEEGGRVVVTTDREDFSIYRIHGRQAVPALMPPA